MKFRVCLDTPDNSIKPCIGAFKDFYLVDNPDLTQFCSMPFLRKEGWFIEFSSFNQLYKFMQCYEKLSVELQTGFERLIIIDSKWISFKISAYDEFQLYKNIFSDEA